MVKPIICKSRNVNGGEDWQKDRLIPDCIKALENNEDVKIRNPEVTLPWQSVLESLSGYLPLVSKMYQEPGIFSGACNFGTNCNSIVSVRKIVSMIVEKWGDGK